MSRKDFSILLDATPFRPFRIYLTDGKTIEIDHPEFVTLFPTSFQLATPNPSEGLRAVDDVIYVSLLHVVRTEFIAPLKSQEHARS